MRPRDYDINLDGCIYREVLFVIDPNQFDEPIDRALEGWFETDTEAKEAAQTIADELGQSVEVEAHGKWSMYGSEFVDSFTVKPCPFKALRDELVSLGI